jgi:hypothetical protein
MDVPSDQRTLTALIYVADRLAAETGMGFRHDLNNTDVDPAVMDYLKLTAEKLAEVRSNLASTAKDATAVLTLN